MEKLLARRTMHQQYYYCRESERDRLLFASVVFDEWWCIEYVYVFFHIRLMLHVSLNTSWPLLRHHLMLVLFLFLLLLFNVFNFYLIQPFCFFSYPRIISNLLRVHFYISLCAVNHTVWLIYSFSFVCIYYPKWNRITNRPTRSL